MNCGCGFLIALKTTIDPLLLAFFNKFSAFFLVCSFVGCHAGVSHHPPKITINSSIQVEDGTSSALLICQNSTQLKKIFNLKPEEWLELERESKSQGELLYLYSGMQFKSAKKQSFIN